MIKSIAYQLLTITLALGVLASCGNADEKTQQADKDAQYTVDYLVENKEVRQNLLPRCEGEYASRKELSQACTNLVEANATVRKNYHDVSNPNNTRMKTEVLFGEEK